MQMMSHVDYILVSNPHCEDGNHVFIASQDTQCVYIEELLLLYVNNYSSKDHSKTGYIKGFFKMPSSVHAVSIHCVDIYLVSPHKMNWSVL